MWFDNGRYIGSLKPGAFKDGERLTQQTIRKRIAEVGFHDPLFIATGNSTATSAVSVATTTSDVCPDLLDAATFKWPKL